MLSPEQIATLKCIREGRELPNPLAHLPAWAGFVGQGTMTITTAGSAYLELYDALEVERARVDGLQGAQHQALHMADESRRDLTQTLIAAQQHLAHSVAVVAPDRDFYPEERLWFIAECRRLETADRYFDSEGRARLIAEYQRLQAAAPSAPIVAQAPADAPFPVCPVHGVVEADDEGCCPECARDCVVVADAASADVVEMLGETVLAMRRALEDVLADLGPGWESVYRDGQPLDLDGLPVIVKEFRMQLQNLQKSQMTEDDRRILAALAIIETELVAARTGPPRADGAPPVREVVLRYHHWSGLFEVEGMTDDTRFTCAKRDRLTAALRWYADQNDRPARSPEHRGLTERCEKAEQALAALQAACAVQQVDVDDVDELGEKKP